MSSQMFRFAHKTERNPHRHHGQGRNGIFQAHGVYVSVIHYEVALSNITSRNNIANHTVVMPPETMDALAAWWIENRKKEQS